MISINNNKNICELNEISNTELTERISILQSKERSVVLRFLIHLGEFDKRGLYLKEGYSSLFDYCTRKLNLSEGSAFRRMTAARFLRDHPKCIKSFVNGDITICSIVASAKAIKSAKAGVEDIIGKSAIEVKSLMAIVAPVSKPKEVIKEITIASKIKPRDELLELFKGMVLEEIESEVQTVKDIETRYEIKFSVTKDIFNKIQSLKSKLSNKLGADLSLENIFTELINKSLSPGTTRKAKPANENLRYIPASIKREVLDRDNSQCSYVSKDGVRCTQKHYLNFDHIQPFALGGKSSSENLRVLCSAHNQMFNRMIFGERVN